MKRILLFTLLLLTEIFAQHNNGLQVMPPHLYFRNNFERSQRINVRNNSNTPVTIDSITYAKNIYLIRLNEIEKMPVTVEPHSGFSFELRQYNYFNLQPADSASTIYIHNSSADSIIQIRAHHRLTMQPMMTGIIQGTVQDSSNTSISGAFIYFFLNETLLIDSVVTEANGIYKKELPVGEYFVAAQKEGYYVQYAYGKDSPLNADVVAVDKHTPANVDFVLEEQAETDIGVDGTVVDENRAALPRAIVVVRKGKHTPTKIVANTKDEVNRSYTVFTDENGKYKLDNIQFPGDYFIQAFSSFNIPGYYNRNNESVVFWQNADSVEIFNHVNDIDITLKRDSSYGAGFVNGTVHGNNQNTFLNEAIVYVMNSNTNEAYSYNFVQPDGKYSVPVLPYGEYKIVAQKIGYPDAESDNFSITTLQDTVTGIDLSMAVTDINNEILEKDFQLFQNYPNPFNPATTIEYTVQNRERVKLNIYNSIGERVTTLLNKFMEPGNYKIQFDAGNLASGIYFYELRVSNSKKIRKMLLLK